MSTERIAVGMKFGRWTVEGPLVKGAHYNKFAPCVCDCGTRRLVESSSLLRSGTSSCGCGPRGPRDPDGERHGETKGGHSKEYRAWRGMIGRCTRPRHKNYASYGGRGISVCASWRHSYRTFLADVGRAPSWRHSIDRINPNGNYEPGNVRWATPTEQADNRTITVLLCLDGITKPLAAWARETGVPYRTLHSRLRKEGQHPGILRRKAPLEALGEK